MTCPYTSRQLRAYRESIGAPWFELAWSLNVFVVRSEQVGRWDDWLIVCAVDEHGREVYHASPVTGEAWEGEWTDPTHPAGCIYVLDQHAVSAYAPGLHKGRRALRQVGQLRYVRWAGDGVPSVAQLEAMAGAEWAVFVDNRGTHIHDRVSDRQPAKPARDDSEGCVVFLRRPDRDHVLALVAEQLRHRGSDRVSVTFVRAIKLGAR